VDERRHELQKRFLSSAHIIACTLAGSGLEVLKNAQLGIDCVIVDEAAQCIEPEVLVPLQYGCRKVLFDLACYVLLSPEPIFLAVHLGRGPTTTQRNRHVRVCGRCRIEVRSV
jgi:hypothetical protein